jgi:hypothetical protein
MTEQRQDQERTARPQTAPNSRAITGQAKGVLTGTPPLVIDRLRHCVGVAPPGRGWPKPQSPQLSSDNTL